MIEGVEQLVKVSVIIPTFNRRELLREAVASVRAQTYSDYEIIVSDDGSTDGTALDYERASSDLTFLGLPHTGLPGSVRNAGMEAARGEFIAFLDSDDTWKPDKLAQHMEALEKSPDIALVCSNATMQRAGSQDRPYHLKRIVVDGPATGLLLRDNFIITSSVVIRREALGRLRFSEDARLRALEDYDLWLRLSVSRRFTYLDRELVNYLDQQSSVRSEESLKRHWAGICLIYQGLAADDLAEEDARTLKDVLFDARMALCLEMFRCGDLRDSLREGSPLLLHRPLRFLRALSYDFSQGRRR
jgi:glycosyltransferase involved in cell wall biosynthesis